MKHTTKCSHLLLLILIVFTGCATDKQAIPAISPIGPVQEERQPSSESNDRETALSPSKPNLSDSRNNPSKSNLPIETDNKDTEKPVEIEPPEEENLEERINSILKTMTTQEKIGQLLLISVRNSFEASRMVKADDYMKKVINSYKPGGIILFTINFDDPIQTRDLIRETQAMSPFPLFFAVDEEGGKVARLGNTEGMMVTKLPPASVIGNTEDVKNARIATEVISRELKALGFNMNMAPVADVNTNPDNPVIGDRTYSHIPVKAGIMVSQVVETMEEENIISVLKHFPGHGDTKEDTHLGGVVLELDRKRLERVEFVPFKMGVEAGADIVMTAHIKVPQVTGDDLPATMSPLLLQDILRDQIGFDGIIMTDAMDMRAITDYWYSGEAAVKAIQAGVDIILIPAKPGEAIQGIEAALESGELTMERIEQSVRRILKVKIQRGVWDQSQIGSEEILQILGSEEHERRIKEIEG